MTRGGRSQDIPTELLQILLHYTFILIEEELLNADDEDNEDKGNGDEKAEEYVSDSCDIDESGDGESTDKGTNDPEDGTDDNGNDGDNDSSNGFELRRRGIGN
ncbi:unnamed protein product [Hymenolepis diminuta]|uniref:Uncharacterized protein n=1 Tax=Hymenolepis diminuta TaxID=6216 RepID=A0A0R3SS80_HYMDI|nr:unnamed protein product [Hymenolepis diminuta]VUZ43817.1 unnamed protein product [Hymenolepis diminuta]